MKLVAITAAAAALAFAGAASAQDFDVEAGAKVFNKCKACHMVGDNAKNRVGPVLNGVVGRPWGVIDGFKYSAGGDGTLADMAAAGDKKWDYATLDAYLTNPKDVIPKGRMAFAGLKDEADRVNVIAYLAQFAEDGSQRDPAEALAAVK